MDKNVFTGIIMCAALFSLAAQDAAVTDFISAFDDLYRSSSSRARMRLEITTPHWEREMEMLSWTQGQEKMLIKVVSPRRERNMGTLKVENQLWNYMPRTDRITKIPPSMMMADWMGSDFTNDDLTGAYTLSEDYTVSREREDDDYNYFSAVPKEGRPIIWGELLIKAHKKSHIPAQQTFYDEHGEVVRTMKFSNITTFGDRTIPATLELIPTEKENQKTVLHYVEVEFNAEIDPDRFSTHALRRPVRGE
ncbi:MAG: outer membrane lipoprotein-sorting protein [Fibrobacterota bacterium]